jgi:hypothetical protein
MDLPKDDEVIRGISTDHCYMPMTKEEFLAEMAKVHKALLEVPLKPGVIQMRKDTWEALVELERKSKEKK